MLTFSLKPLGKSPDANAFFQTYLAAPLVIALYLFWKIKTRFAGPFFVRAKDMDVDTGRRELDFDPADMPIKTFKNLPKRLVEGLF